MTAPLTDPPFDFAAHRQLALENYRLVRPAYEHFAEAVRSVLRASIPTTCPIHSIEARAKGLEAFADKAAKPREDGQAPRYPNPVPDITDLAGVRVITFFPRNLADVCVCIDGQFRVIERLDKGEELMAAGRFGYHSIHYVATFAESRLALPEYQRFHGLVVEIQVRTILQHAWAEMEHDIQYKSVITIPAAIRRRFMSLAGMLEIADREFQAIQDTDSQLRQDVQVPLVEEVTRSEALKVEAATPDEAVESKQALIPPQQRTYVAGSARALLAAGYYEEAVRAYTTVIDNYPTVHSNYLGRARAFYLSGNFARALADVATAWSLCPTDPQVSQLRDQIRNEVESLNVDSLRPEVSEAQLQAFEGNSALAAGQGDIALNHYEAAEAGGWSFVYSQFNKVMAHCVRGTPGDAKEYLEILHPSDDSYLGINTTALRAVCALLEGEPHQELLTRLQTQVQGRPFDFSKSPLVFLEQGLRLQSESRDRTVVVFAILKGSL